VKRKSYYFQFFTALSYANFTRRFLYPEILDGGHTESSYRLMCRLATENDIDVISTAAAMFLGSPNPRPPASTP